MHIHRDPRHKYNRNVLTESVFAGERKDFEVYSCDVSPDGKRLVTAAGGEFCWGNLAEGSCFLKSFSNEKKRKVCRAHADCLNV